MTEINYIEDDGSFNMTQTMFVDLQELLEKKLKHYTYSIKEGFFIATKMSHEKNGNIRDEHIYFYSGNFDHDESKFYRIHQVTNTYSNIVTKPLKPLENINERNWDINQNIRIHEVLFRKEYMNQKVAITTHDYFNRGSEFPAINNMVYRSISDMINANVLNMSFYNYDYPIIDGILNKRRTTNEIRENSLYMTENIESAKYKN